MYTTGRPDMRLMLNLSLHFDLASSKFRPRTSTVLESVRIAMDVDLGSLSLMVGAR